MSAPHATPTSPADGAIPVMSGRGAANAAARNHTQFRAPIRDREGPRTATLWQGRDARWKRLSDS